MPDATQHSRLPRNFHRTFKPERQYIHALLRFAASGGEGDAQQIGAATGIPTGVSTGKVPAILDYCRGMGLVRLAGPDRSSVKRPELTPFGQIVLLEDPYLKLAITQWVAHLNLCSPLTGADVWYQTCFAGTQFLGMTFERVKLESHLSVVYEVEKSGLIGPMIGTYEDDAALKVCGALSEAEGTVHRKMAPVSEEMALGYGAWLLQLIQSHFPKTRQVSITELDSVAGWRTIPGWDISSVQRILELMTRKGVIDVDRHMEPWLIAPSADADQTWKRIYDDML
jgi:hypothetical protein